ncbi:MAG: hypothetical protein DSY91_04690 [Deltaproteobacteria bacterium]|nr:MAG: hypothetical protein DSY91_04690 [Deltaproteobacteria bacterium]
MKVVLICDNRPYAEGLMTSWGLSVGLLGADGWTLFDLGNSPDVFLHNFTALGGDLKSVKRIILSHLHHDHSGGLEAFRDVGRAIPLYLPERIPGDEVGLLESWGLRVSYVPVSGVQFGDLWILPMPQGSPPEQLIVLETGQGIALLTGCAHFGIENGMAEVWRRFHRPFDLVCGGFHFAFRSPTALEETLRLMDSLPIVRIAPCHCTGDEAIEVFARTFPKRFLRVGTGWSLSLGGTVKQDGTKTEVSFQ